MEVSVYNNDYDQVNKKEPSPLKINYRFAKEVWIRPYIYSL